MRAVVTGGAGFIGSALVEALLRRGDEVVVVDDLSAGQAVRLPADAELHRADIRDLDAIYPAFEGAEVVFHQAAIRSVPKSVEDPAPVVATNVDGTLNVLLAAEQAGLRRLVYASSSSVYGAPGADGVNREGQATSPRSPYAVSKLAGEQLASVWSHLGRLSTVALRYFNVFGPGQRRDSLYAAVFPAFIGALQAGEAPEVHGDGEQSRDFCYIDDVVAANLAAAAAADADGAVLNVAGGGPRTVNEVLRAVAEAVGTWIDPVHTDPRPGDVRRSQADISEARAVLGWTPRADWNAAVRSTVDGFAAV